MEDLIKQVVIKKIYMRLKSIKVERENKIMDFFEKIKDHILFDELRFRFEKNPKLYSLYEPGSHFYILAKSANHTLRNQYYYYHYTKLKLC